MSNVNVKLTITPSQATSNPASFLWLTPSDITKSETISLDLADDNKRAAYLNKLYANDISQVIRQQAAKKGLLK
jgi:hypothetical protein